MLRYKVKIPTKSGVTASHINIPISMENQMVDQSEIIQRKFVDIEVNNSINPIFDYEKVRFKPLPNGASTNTVSYNLVFNGGITTYDGIGFNDTDLANRKNGFTQSFLRLSFYDSDNLATQRLISFITLFSSLYEADTNAQSQTVAASNKTLSFKTIHPKFKTLDPSEGFYVYHFKDEVVEGIPKELYMKAEFNNAKTGSITNFMSKNTLVSIDNLVKQIHTKYVLKRDTTNGYYYEIDNTQGNVVYGTDTVVNLFEIDSL